MGYSRIVPALPILGTRAIGGNRLGASLPILGVLVAGLMAAVVAATMDPLIAIMLAGGLALILLSVRWPLLSLFVFIALITIEETVNVTGFGTLSRWAGIVFAGVYGIPRLGRLVPSALPLAGWAYVSWALLSVAWALNSATAVGQLQTLVQLVVIGFLVADVVIHDPSVVRPILWTYSISATATAAVGIVLYLTGGAADGGRLAAIANQNPAQFASILLPALIFSLYQVLQGRRVAASGLIAVMCTAGIALSGTRSVWLAATVVILFLMLPRLGIRRGILALGVVGVLVLATAQIPGVASIVADRTETAASSGGAGRTDIWSVGFQIFESSPVIGVGYANFPVAFTPSLLRAANANEAIGTAQGPHNIVVGTAGELGIVGLVLLALFLVPLILRRGWGPDGVVIQAILTSLMIDALFIDIVGNRKQVWVAIGLAAGLAYLAKQDRRRAAAAPAAGPLSLPAAASPARQPRGAIRGRAPGGTA